MGLDGVGPLAAPGLNGIRIDGPLTEQVVYRIASEALANVAAHARARQMHVRLASTGNRLALEVQDDGQGFDLSEAPEGNHFGIQGMRERAELVGGELNVKSVVGQGTTVQLSLEVGP
jgi:signal transduction histidine kinase